MLFNFPLTFALQLSWIALGVANQDLTVTIPWVTDAPDYFKGYGAKVIGLKDGATVYGINCLPDQSSCNRFNPDLTVAYGPSTYEMFASGYNFDFTSGCTLTGSPTPTEASCTETKSFHKKAVVDTATVVVPATGTDSSLGIFPATLIVTDTGDLPATSTATRTQPAQSDSSTTKATITATGHPIIPTANATVGYLNATGTTTGAPVIWQNDTSSTDNNGPTVTVTVLASPLPCRCECDCRGTVTPLSAAMNSTKKESHAVKIVAPMALATALVAAVFWY
ncbi:uncharacterized protein N7515_009907 [Penicillium bovifimosum]|uniref:Uncharacterized protein n=1 Tax=Penicillium bovifimosum TaxID=126998 RepID=A0A9W9KUS7_9EURO|nr:uncharacterized protein N7515_009907 [Penicillium bovifimosum]KAJ5120519.1 hypothetical protein N7515_009907 [Penicillium bovifimosum]